MKKVITLALPVEQQDREIAETLLKEQGRLRNFIRKRVPDEKEAEDILQDVFYQLVEAYRSMKPIEQVSAWLFRVTRNKITDLFRKKRPDRLEANWNEEEEGLSVYELLPSPDAGPEASYTHGVLMEELNEALSELPKEQQEVFIAHEVEGRSFKELSEQWGVTVNTLLSRKRYAILHLRERLEKIYNEFIYE